MTLPVPKRPVSNEMACSSTFTAWRRPIVWIGLAALIATGFVLNWHWLVAAGVLPVLFGVMPCLAMCALHLCSKGKGDTSTAPEQPNNQS
jgi:hypothetical protein